MELKLNLIGSGIDTRMQPRQTIPDRPLDSKAQAIIDLILSDKGGRMTVGQVAELFSVDRCAVMNIIRSHARIAGKAQALQQGTISLEAT